MSSDPAVKKLKELAAQLDNATAAGKRVVKEVAKAPKKAATAANLIKNQRKRR